MISERLYPFSTRKIAIDGNNLSFIDEGDGETVVMLHGNPTWSFYYRNLITSLKKNYRVVVPDHMGCGFSDKPQDYPYRLENHISNLEHLLEQIDGPVSLIVHDWGGAIGCGYAGRHPDRIKSLVILNSAAFRSSRIPLRISLCRIPILGEFIVRGLNGFAFPATFMAVSRKMKRDVKQGILAPYANWQDRIAIYKFVKDIPLSSDHPSWQTLVGVENNLKKLRDKPTLILWGGKDFCFNDHFYNEWLSRFPNAEKKYFPEAGHYVLEDSYVEIIPLVENFLDGKQ